MNSGVVVKIEYRLIGNLIFADLDVIPYSGSISEKWKKPFAGLIATVDVDFKKENWSPANNTLMKSLLNRKAQYRVTDANGTVSLVGSDKNPSRMIYEAQVAGAAGSFNGFTCAITWLSPTGCAKT